MSVMPARGVTDTATVKLKPGGEGATDRESSAMASESLWQNEKLNNSRQRAANGSTANSQQGTSDNQVNGGRTATTMAGVSVVSLDPKGLCDLSRVRKGPECVH